MNSFKITEYIQPLDPIPTSLRYNGKLDQSIRCVLFDIYGTLFISGSGDIGIAKKAFQETEKLQGLLRKFAIRKSPQAVLDELFAGIEKTHESLKQKGIEYPEVVIENIWMRVLDSNDVSEARAFAVEFEWLVNPVYPMPHLAKMLSVCRESKILMGIISNAQFYTPYLFNRFLDSSPEDLGFHPDLTLYSYAYGHAKPSTFMFKAAAERLQQKNIPAHSTLYLGNDMLNDIYPAKITGFATALFAGDARSLRLRKDHFACRHLSADLIITDLLQLLDHIAG
ncbi:MAG: HAD family hydrolase [Desulfobacterales bacterium]|nr:MAG: HAD family hydrolase [Desulfobacterales bacterium]UCD91148.1 MAG: HAD family hydrolase [Desulfobacterales bacterium]